MTRPKKLPEAIWSVAGAAAMVALGSLTPIDALKAAARGQDVYLFLTGMMILSELARREGLFDWLAGIAVERAGGSPKRLFTMVYAVGTLVTVFLSNDATAVVLTPAVLTAIKRAKATPLPFLLICAFIANAASFVLPISNPANLVIYGSKLPALASWFEAFGIPSAAAVLVTYAMLLWVCRKELEGRMETAEERTRLSAGGKLAAFGIAGAAAALMAASAMGMDLGAPTLAVALVAAVLVAIRDRRAPLGIAREISWSVLPLIAGLFVLVEAVDRAGALAATRRSLEAVGPLGAAFGAGLIANVANNLPVGLVAGNALHGANVDQAVRNAVLMGVDLGPNLSVTGSLATILWLSALRREGEDVGFWKFLRYGAAVMPPALGMAVLATYIHGLR